MNEENNKINLEKNDAPEEPVTELTENTFEENAAAPEPSVAEEGIFVFPDNTGRDVASEPQVKKSASALIIAAVVAIAVIAVAAILVSKNWSTWFNKYNRMGYVDVSGRTVEDVADASGMELSEFLEQYGLPADMPANTTESAAYYMIPVSKIAASYGMDFATLKDVLQWDDSITEDTTWGEAEGETTLGVYVGEEGLEEFKEQFGLDDSVTADTKWKEVRTIVDTKNKEANEEARKAEEAEEDSSIDAEDESSSEEDTADNADGEAQDTSADSDLAE